VSGVGTGPAPALCETPPTQAVEVAEAVLVLLEKDWAEARPARARTKADAYIFFAGVEIDRSMGEASVGFEEVKAESEK